MNHFGHVQSFWLATCNLDIELGLKLELKLELLLNAHNELGTA